MQTHHKVICAAILAADRPTGRPKDAPGRIAATCARLAELACGAALWLVPTRQQLEEVQILSTSHIRKR